MKVCVYAAYAFNNSVPVKALMAIVGTRMAHEAAAGKVVGGACSVSRGGRESDGEKGRV